MKDTNNLMRGNWISISDNPCMITQIREISVIVEYEYEGGRTDVTYTLYM